MAILYVANCEVSVPPGDLESGRTLAFTNVVTWGENPEDALTRIRNCFAEYKWSLLECQRIDPVDEAKVYGDDELNDAIERAAHNPNAVIFGTFYTYKPN